MRKKRIKTKLLIKDSYYHTLHPKPLKNKLNHLKKNNACTYKYLTDEQKEYIGKKRKPRLPRDIRRRNSMNEARKEQEFYNLHGYLP